MKIISLLTDFGLQDGYAGVLKGGIWNIAPDAQIMSKNKHFKDKTGLKINLHKIYKKFLTEKLNLMEQSNGYEKSN